MEEKQPSPGRSDNIRNANDAVMGHSGSTDDIARQTMSAFRHAYLVVDRTNHQLVWMSPGAESALAQLTLLDAHSLSMHYPKLCAAIDEHGGDINRVGDARVSLVLDEQCFQCQFVMLSDQQIGVMVNADDEHLVQLRKYMADREQLFSTSRTISVSEMATSLAHEINQPVGTIANILKGLKARLNRIESTPDECIVAIDRALEQTNFAARIVVRIRDFTQARQPKRVDCDVHKLLDESVRLLDWVLVQSEVSVTLSPAPEAVWVNADATMLQQVFTNLIRNAVDAMHEAASEDRKLGIKAYRVGDDVHVEITDSGHGLTETDQENLFIPFVTQKTQGMGVGLNICRSFVELHQGKLWLAPNDVGGCTASVLLPAVVK